MRLLLAAFAAVLLHVGSAEAQCYFPSGSPNGPCLDRVLPYALQPDGTGVPASTTNPLPVTGAVTTAPTRTTPSGGNVTLTTSAATVISSTTMATANAVRWQAQGTGYGCASWVTASVTITGTDGTAVCGGNGAFLFTAGSRDPREGGVLPNGTLTAVAATGASLRITYEVE